jgi:hypothetical protein
VRRVPLPRHAMGRNRFSLVTLARMVMARHPPAFQVILRCQSDPASCAGALNLRRWLIGKTGLRPFFGHQLRFRRLRLAIVYCEIAKAISAWFLPAAPVGGACGALAAISAIEQ